MLDNITNETKKFLQICLNSIAHEVNGSTCLATLYKELVCLALDCIFTELATVAVGRVEPYFDSVPYRESLKSELTAYKDNIRNLIQNEEVDRELLLGQVYNEE